MSNRLRLERLTVVRLLSLVVFLHAIPVFAREVVSVDPSLPPDTSGLTAFVSVFPSEPCSFEWTIEGGTITSSRFGPLHHFYVRTSGHSRRSDGGN